MLLAIALYAGLFGGMSANDTTMFRWISMFVAVPGLGYAATPFFATAIGALRVKRLHLDLPLSIGITAGLGWGTANVLRGTGEIYFDSLAMLVFLLLVSRWIVLRHQRRASSAAELLLSLTPSRAHRVEGDVTTDVAIEAIVPGNLIAVRVGEVVPVDGGIVDGCSALDVGLLTGESKIPSRCGRVTPFTRAPRTSRHRSSFARRPSEKPRAWASSSRRSRRCRRASRRSSDSSITSRVASSR